MTPTEIRKIISDLGRTQAEIAAAAGMSIPAIARACAHGSARGSLPTLLRLFAREPGLVDKALEINRSGE